MSFWVATYCTRSRFRSAQHGWCRRPLCMHKRVRALVIGADGLIGSALSSALGRSGHFVIETTRRSRQEGERNRISLDLADDSFVTLLPKVDIAYFCAAMTGFAECQNDPGRAHQINVSAPNVIGRRLVQSGSRVVLLSTSAVFDCLEPRMATDRPYSPRGVYGATKAAAEAAFLGLGPAACVLRLTKVLTPETPLVRQWIDNLGASRHVEAFGDVGISPLKVEHVTSALLALAEQPATGVYQISGAGDVSYAELALHLARRLAASPSLVDRCDAVQYGISQGEVLRFTSLDTSRLSYLTRFVPPAPLDVVDEVFGPALRAQRAGSAAAASQ